MSFITEDSSACFSFCIVFPAQPTHFFLAFLGIASLNGNISVWQLCACYAWGKKPWLPQSPLPLAAMRRYTGTLSSLGGMSGRYVVLLSLDGWITHQLEQLNGSWSWMFLMINIVGQYPCYVKYPSCCCHNFILTVYKYSLPTTVQMLFIFFLMHRKIAVGLN